MDVVTITEFLLARIAEDEAGARAVVGDRNAWDTPEWDASRWSPWRVLDECEAKRRIVDDVQCGWFDTDLAGACKHLAAVYSDHPDYDEEWKP